MGRKSGLLRIPLTSLAFRFAEVEAEMGESLPAFPANIPVLERHMGGDRFDHDWRPDQTVPSQPIIPNDGVVGSNPIGGTTTSLPLTEC